MRGDIVSGLVAVQMGGGGNVTVSDIPTVFETLTPEITVPIADGVEIRACISPDGLISRDNCGLAYITDDEGKYIAYPSTIINARVLLVGLYLDNALVHVYATSYINKSFTGYDYVDGKTVKNFESVTSKPVDTTASEVKYSSTVPWAYFKLTSNVTVTNTTYENGAVKEETTAQQSVTSNLIGVWSQPPTQTGDVQAIFAKKADISKELTEIFGRIMNK